MDIFSTFLKFIRLVFPYSLLDSKKIDRNKLEEIEEYLNIERPKHIENNSTILTRQFAQKKIPILNNLSVNELDDLIDKKESDMDGIFNVVWAKGGALIGFGYIEYNSEEGKYLYKKNGNPTTALIVGLIMIFSLFLYISFFLSNYQITDIVKFIIHITLVFLFVTISTSILSFYTNCKNAYKELQKDKYRHIFE